MPIVIGDKPVLRVKFKDIDIRRVRKADDLTWGLYEITYHNPANGSDTGGNIKKYVWGTPNPDDVTKVYTLLKPTYSNDYTAAQAASIFGAGAAYKSRCGKKVGDKEYWWLVDNDDADLPHEYIEYDSDGEFSYIPAIDFDFKKDLEFYVGWRQKRYTWEGSYSMTVWR